MFKVSFLLYNIPLRNLISKCKEVSIMIMYEKLRKELRDFFGDNGGRVCVNPERLATLEKCRNWLEEFASAHPQASAYELRRKIYECAVMFFRPRLFPHSPFFADISGNGGWHFSAPGHWLLKHNISRIQNQAPDIWKKFREQGGECFFFCCGPYFDEMHNCPPLSNVLKHGFRFYYEKAQQTLAACRSTEETEFIRTAIAGLEAVKTILEKTAAAAQIYRQQADDPEIQQNMAMIADTAGRVPWNPPQTFYEGLCTIWFVREIMGELDGMATNTLGRPDAWLETLYQADLENGRITPERAYDLICRFLLLADMMYSHDTSVIGYGDHENECVFTLGGCDSAGKPVFNDLTRMFLKAHRELGCIYPKPHCRYCSASPEEYLKLICSDILSGRGVYSLINDDSIIPALVKDGKSLEDARNYCCTGCWDIVVDSCEDNEGGNYFNLARVLEATIYESDQRLQELGLKYKRIDDAATFEDVYSNLMENVLQTLQGMMKMEQLGAIRSQVAPAPLDSACSSDCLEKRLDYTAGGQRYNPHAVSLCFFANFLDSMLAIDDLCFRRRLCSLQELLSAVRNNWRNADELRLAVLAAPHWGDAKPETIRLAQRFFNEVYERTRGIKNSRGGDYQLGCWVYREFRFWGEKTRALPDGRHDGDELAQSLNPSHFRNHSDITTMLRCLSSLDFSKMAGDSVINIMLDKTGLTSETMEALVRSCAALKLQLLQLNCSSRQELLEAQKHPEAYPNLIVRLCGFSAKFTSLSKEWQNEVINRKDF